MAHDFALMGAMIPSGHVKPGISMLVRGISSLTRLTKQWDRVLYHVRPEEKHSLIACVHDNIPLQAKGCSVHGLVSVVSKPVTLHLLVQIIRKPSNHLPFCKRQAQAA